MPSITILAVYFGQLPATFAHWLKSCSHNQTFTWVVVTDAPTEAYHFPTNVIVRKMCLDEFSARMSDELGFRVNIKTAYKVCDFRPLLWTLLADRERGTEFWGHCDLDLVFGRLKDFIHQDVLSRHDKIFSVGHLTLYRNIEEANRMYRNAHPNYDWRLVFRDDRSWGFDEHNGVNLTWRQSLGRYYENEPIVADIDPNIERFRVLSPRRNFKTQVFFFDAGRVFQGYYHRGDWAVQEYMYLHFQKRRIVSFAAPDSESFYVTPLGFIERPSGSIPTKDDIRRLTKPNTRSTWVSETVYQVRRYFGDLARVRRLR